MVKSRGTKRKAPEAAIATSIQGVDLPPGMQQLLALEPDLAYVLAALANVGNISASQYRKPEEACHPCRPQNGPKLRPNSVLSMILRGPNLTPTQLLLFFSPPSFHETVAEAAWRIQDVYQERISQEREEVRVRAFDAVCPTVEECFRVLTLHQVPYPIVGLFQGRVIDRPEHPMTSTAYSSGGEVEHEVGVLLNICRLSD